MSLETDIRNTITEICMEKYRNRVEPMHATFREIVGIVKVPHEEVKACINRMIQDGRLEWGRTINDNYFRNIPKK